MDPLDPLNPRHEQTGSRWLDLIVPASAIFIAMVSLFIALRQSSIMERQLAASTWPYLQYGTSNQDDQGKPAIVFEVENAGVGPAHVHSITMTYDGKPVTTPKGIINACCNDLREANKTIAYHSSTVHEQVLTPNRTAHFFVLLNAPENTAYWQRLNTERDKFAVRICYCSVLDQCWMLDSLRSEPAPIAACPAAQPDDYDG